MKESKAISSSDNKVFREAIALHQAAAAGDPRAAGTALPLFEKLHTLYPEDDLIAGYLGSTYGLLARDEKSPMTQIENAVRGLKLLDQAVTNTPLRPEIRLLRAKVCSRLPEMYFHRTGTAIEDLDYLITRCEQDPALFPLSDYYQLLFDLAAAYETLEQNEKAQTVRAKLAEKTRAANPVGDNTGHWQSLSGNLEEIMRESEGLHVRALNGSKTEASLALDFFNKAMALYPEHSLLAAYQADCLSLSGREATNSAQLFGSAIKAAKKFDQIVSRTPEEIPVRLLRAGHALRLPEGFFHRTATAVTDYEYIRTRYEQNPSVLSPEQYGQALYHLGLAYQRLGLYQEADQIWKKLLMRKIDPIYGQLIATARQTHFPPQYRRNLRPRRGVYYQEATRLHELAVTGNRPAARIAYEMWEKAHTADPDDPTAAAYLGSSMALMGRDAAEPMEIFGYTIKGLKLLNQAVTQDTGNIQIRLLRVFVVAALPESFFHQTEQALQDLHFLKEAYERNAQCYSRELYLKVTTLTETMTARVAEEAEKGRTYHPATYKDFNPELSSMLGQIIPVSEEEPRCEVRGARCEV